MDQDWYERLQADGVLDVLAPYQPVLVGAYPLGIAPPDAPVEIACRSSDLGAFARAVERVYGERPGFALFGGELDGEDAVFAEFEAGGLPVEVAAQTQHVHRRLGAATVGLARALEQRGPVDRNRLAQQVAGGEDWLETGLRQLSISRSALEALAGASPSLVRRVSGVREPGPPLRTYVLPIMIAVVAEALILIAATTHGSGAFTGAMLMLEAAILGGLFGLRLGVTASLAPIALFGLLIGASMAVGSESSADLGDQAVAFAFLCVLVGGSALVTGALRDRYFSRAG